MLELRNCLLALSYLDDSTNYIKWETIKNIYIESATKVLGSREKSNKDWLTPDTWQKTEQKRYLKAKMLNTKSLRLLKQAQVAYKNKDQEGKKSARSDKI